MTTDALSLRYDRAAPAWDGKISRLGYNAAYDHLLRAAKLPVTPGRVLDAGCGTGAFVAALLRKRPATAVDLLDASPEMLRQARLKLGRAGQDFSDLFDPDVPETGYDVVLAGHLIEHLDDPAAGLHWLATRAKPGGKLILSVSKPHWCTALIRLVWGHKAFQPDEICAWAKAAALSTDVIAFPDGPPSRTSMGYIMTRPEARSD
ncbi:MAG: class I SAM-dependent methyltransferase [Pseudomonadota bacterium]